MEIFIERDNKTITKSFSGTVLELLKELHINSEEVLIIKNGTLVTEDENVINSDSLKLLAVVSGG